MKLEVRLVVRHPAPPGGFTLDVDFDADGGITVVHGPSGGGKTTLLRSIIGASRPERGRLALDGRVLFERERGIDVPVHRRRVGMVFQDAALFPHLDVTANVTFALPRRRRSRRDALELLERVDAVALASRRPAGLSGGERQRVALARALAAGPSLLLLDEPFSALDRRARSALCDLLLGLHRESGVPFVHVTHDPAEAVRLGDRLILLDAGRIVEQGPPERLLARPGTSRTADLLGSANVFRGKVVRHDADLGHTAVDLGDGVEVLTGLLDDAAVGQELALGLRAEDLLVCTAAPGPTSARNNIRGRVGSIDDRPEGTILHVVTPVPFRVAVTRSAIAELRLRPGSEVHLLAKASAFERLV